MDDRRDARLCREDAIELGRAAGEELSRRSVEGLAEVESEGRAMSDDRLRIPGMEATPNAARVTIAKRCPECGGKPRAWRGQGDWWYVVCNATPLHRRREAAAAPMLENAIKNWNEDMLR